ncbi:hypothetical protein BD289DRAFT_483896 [Coniella lustricola]|uniref:Uncharacterized protein n=1 Tax=Coniella lustricola TaxID=2025994 RepID=A0A2T3A3V3_9PEZI|nr:hypothetical protein BD289DRAFT_483896 [Coniella lustricola]
MLNTSAKRMISATTRVYPPIPPMSPPGISSTAARRGLANIKWVPTMFALVSIGYGISTYRRGQLERYSARTAELERQEAERRRANALLMDAYGDGSSLEGVEKAMALYEAQQQRRH